MTAIVRHESRKRLRGSVILVAVFAVLSMMYYSMFPGMQDDIDDIIAAFPEAFLEAFGIEAFHTIEGFIAAEVYSFFWVLLVAIYFAYVSAGMIAGDIRNRRMDLTLSNPVSRESVILQKFASLWVPLVVLNVAVPLIVYVGALVIGESFNPVALAMVHLLSIPYLLVCAGIGIVLSVVVDRARKAQVTALVLVFVLYLFDAISNLSEDLEWLEYLTPAGYYDETAILVREEYAYADAGVLLVAAFVLLIGATVLFVRRDI